MVALIQSIALDIAGLGLLGAGAYSLITGTGGTDAATALMTLGGGYLGYKVAAATVTVAPTPVVPTPAPVATKLPAPVA
jgi:hypothetical protein